MIAPNNFVMQNKQAIVTSQENINSSSVQQAISRCPVQIIEILEA
jgi:ferredoxin